MPPIRRYKWVGPGYVETMGNRLVAGRLLTWNDAYQAAPVVVISETLAREYWKTPAAAIGKRIRNTPANPWREIVGVVGDERDDGLLEAAPHHRLLAAGGGRLLDREDVRPAQPGVRRAVWTACRSSGFHGRTAAGRLVGQRQPACRQAQSLAEIRASSMAQTSFALTMLAIAAVVALLLGVVGIYGVIAYIAAQRTREIGVRMALGAQASDVRTPLRRHGLKLVAASASCWAWQRAMALTRLMSALLFGVGPMDPPTYVAVSLVLGTLSRWSPRTSRPAAPRASTPSWRCGLTRRSRGTSSVRVLVALAGDGAIPPRLPATHGKAPLWHSMVSCAGGGPRHQGLPRVPARVPSAPARRDTRWSGRLT